MAQVGDIIMDVRSLGPDLPGVTPIPIVASIVDQNTAGAFLPIGTYFVVVCWMTPWGVSLPSLEGTVNVTHNSFFVTVNQISAGAAGVSGLRVYFTQANGLAGSESQYCDLTGSNFINGNSGLVGQATGVGIPPQRSTAYLPDTDGAFVSSFTVFRWLNEALKKATLITGGIQDWGGATSVANQPNYRPTTGVWRKFDHCWYDGWELEQGNKAEIFRNRQITASISRIIAMDVNSSQQVVELYYIPSRSAAVTTTSNILFNTDITVSLTSTAGFSGPPFGLVQIGSEVCFFAGVQGGTLTGLTRGLSGTTSPSQLASGATVREMNILWNGYRLPNVYAVGDSLLTLDVPQGWDSILPKYMLAKFREAEQARQEAASLFKEFDAEFKMLATSNRQLAGPRQARIFDSFGFRGVIPASAGGGLIIR
jgi:hypothetical protein